MGSKTVKYYKAKIYQSVALLLFFFLSIFQSFAHSVQVQYCVSCNGDLRIWIEHWHGTEDPSTTTVSITVDINGTVTSQTSAPGGGVQNVPAGSLPGCSTPIQYVAGCPGDENTYNDWVYYDFLGLPTGVPITFTINSGNTVFTEDGCGMFPLSQTFTIGGSLNISDQTICENTASQVVSLGSASATWTNNNPSIGLAASGTGDVPSFVPVGGPGTTATVTYTNSCTTDNFVFTVEAVPTAGFTTSNAGTNTTTICTGQTMDFTDTSTDANAVTGWTWNFGDGTTSTLQNSSHTYTTSGVYTVSLTASNGNCTDISTTQIQVIDAPVVSVTTNNVPCNGNSDGQITASVSVGTSPYSYQWNGPNGFNGTAPNSGSSDTESNLIAGTYTITISDNSGCASAITSATITEPPILLASVTTTDETCAGASDGTASVSASGGTSPLSYLWNNNASYSTPSISNLTGNTYNVVVTDALGCTVTDSGIVNQGLSISVTATSTPDSCSNNTGTVSTTVTGNQGAVNYSWNNAQTTPNISGLSGGTYSVSVTDAMGCVNSTSVTVEQPSPIVLTLDVNNILCYGAQNGSITINHTGGVTPFTYSWEDGQTTQTAVGLNPDTLTYIVSDAYGCTIVDSIKIFGPTEILSDTVVVNSNCGQNDGAICVSVTGGVTPYSYNWLNVYNWVTTNSTTTCVSGIPSGAYQVDVTDQNGCTHSIMANITDIAGPTISVLSTTDVDCYGNSTGSATVSVSGGSGNFIYSWINQNLDTVNTTPIANNLPAGNYSVLLADSSTQCTDVTSLNIYEPTLVVNTFSFSDPTCFSYNDGSISVSTNGGTNPYTYFWSNGLGSSPSVNNLSAGIYSVDIYDANNCFSTLNFTLINPPQLTANITTTDVACYGGSTGLASATPVNGVGAIDYKWQPTGQVGSTAIGLTAGNYSVTVSDVNNCFYVENFIINEPSQLTGFVSNYNNVSCYGYNDGSIEVQVFGGVPPYTHTWSNNVSTTVLATGLNANTYVDIVSDSNNCSVAITQLISSPSALSVSIAASPASCSGVCDGVASVTVSGGITPYFYQWNVCGGLQQTPVANNLCGNCGASVVTVSDNNGCTSTAQVTINEPSALTVTSIHDEPHCSLADGRIVISAFGGTNPYTYEWPPPLTNTTKAVSGLPAGLYQITVTDNNNCSDVEVVALNDITGPSIDYLNHTNVTCFGSSDGIINTNVTGGTTPYSSIVWTSFPNNQIIDSNIVGMILLAGDMTYCETVVDDAGCQTSFCQYIEEPTPVISAVVNSNDVSCFASNDGSATVLAGGGTGSQSDFTYVWSPTNQTSATATGLFAGNYVVESTDLNGCSDLAYVTITEALQLVSSYSVTNASCFGLSDGCVTFTTSGGTGFYVYNWNSTGNGSAFCGLSAAQYQVTITDQNNCSIIKSPLIVEPTQLQANISSTDAVCTESNGSASITNVSGGTQPYSYAWGSSNLTDPINPGLYPNSYTATVTDANGCTVDLSVTVQDNPAPVITGIYFVTPLCNGDCNGVASVSITGGTSPLFYHWNDVGQQGFQSISGLCAGNYNVTVTDSNGCTATDGAQMNEPLTLSVTGTPLSSQLCAGECETIFASPAGGINPYSIVWGDDGASLPNSFGGHSVCPVENSITIYSFTVTDANNCTASNQIVINTGPPLLIDMPDQVETCLGNPVLISSTGFGGTNISDYQWTWSSGDTCLNVVTCDVSVAPTDTTQYAVTLADGCSSPVTDYITVIVNPIPTPSFAVQENEGCPPFLAEFNGTTSMDNSTLFWDMNGDGIIDFTESNLMEGEVSEPTFEYEESGLYTVQVTVVSEKECESSVVITDYIEVYPRPIASFFLNPETTTLINPLVEVNASSSIGVDSLYSWDFADEFNTQSEYGVTASHLYSDTGFYPVALDVVNTYGCHDYDTLTFEVKADFAIYVPNAFTPDDDGINDGFKIEGVGFDPNNFQLYIYDRWSNVIFKTKDINQVWDGTFKGKPVANDVYIWKVFVKSIADSDKKGYREFVGTVTIVR